MQPSTFSEDLTMYLTPDVTNFLNGWDVFIDLDNNTLTGDLLGVEYRFSVAIRPTTDGTPPQLGSVVLMYEPVGDTYTRFGKLQVFFDPNTQTLNLSGNIPGISSDSRLVFSSRLKDPTTGSIMGDRICD